MEVQELLVNSEVVRISNQIIFPQFIPSEKTKRKLVVQSRFSLIKMPIEDFLDCTKSALQRHLQLTFISFEKHKEKHKSQTAQRLVV